MEIGSVQEIEDLAKRIQTGDQVATRMKVILTANIDFHNRVIDPIGTVVYPYKGIFNGNGYKISGFRIRQDEIGSVGFFGCLMNATVLNLTVEEKVKGGINTGVLCGQNNLSKILYCGGIVESVGYENVGGLCGVNNGIIKCCNFYGYVRETGKHRGLWIFLAAFMLECFLVTGLLLNAANKKDEIIFLPEEVDLSANETDEVFTSKESSGNDNSITLQVQQEATYYLGDKTVEFKTINPSTSNQTAIVELLVFKDEKEEDYLTVAKTGAIPPGYLVESLDWNAKLIGENALKAGTYQALARVSFYNTKTNEKAMVDSVFQITLQIESKPES